MNNVIQTIIAFLKRLLALLFKLLSPSKVTWATLANGFVNWQAIQNGFASWRAIKHKED